jgi:uncharacterized protein
MPLETGKAAIDRAFRSLVPQGRLNLGFFGGEPLLETGRILEWMDYSRNRAREQNSCVRFNVTTNGTISTCEAWQIMMAEDLDLAVSFDGNPAAQDRNRVDTYGRGSSEKVVATLKQLVAGGTSFRVIAVVRPNNLEVLTKGLNYLHELGVRQVELSLDLWTAWTAGDGIRLQKFIEDAAKLWRRWLPGFSLNWFDAKLAGLARIPAAEESTRCGFGAGEIAVAPSGRLYPCERLIGEDRLENPLRLPGHALEGQDFLDNSTAGLRRLEACTRCALVETCDTVCRCSNFVRTGDVNRPDGLLCLFNKAVTEATARMFAPDETLNPKHQNERNSHVQSN